MITFRELNVHMLNVYIHKSKKQFREKHRRLPLWNWKHLSSVNQVSLRGLELLKECSQHIFPETSIYILEVSWYHMNERYEGLKTWIFHSFLHSTSVSASPLQISFSVMKWPTPGEVSIPILKLGPIVEVLTSQSWGPNRKGPSEKWRYGFKLEFEFCFHIEAFYKFWCSAF